jgi:hypothetical protein
MRATTPAIGTRMMFVAQNIDALIAFLGGAYCTYLAFRGVPAGTAKAGEWQVWLASWGRLLKILGPILMITGLGQLLVRALA